ncbi:MAG: ABC transporter ATP-binding protein [Lentisphaeria bacterium]|nr:ABC transporter ATP-binding protein [Lentisphaeria bacterium]MBR3506806.1 ABC transporter ATP-binding protein [Lentisphaeria bacterium]
MNLTVSKLTRTFTRADETIELFRDFDLTLNAGEALTVLGPSGSGKTTLLRMIAGLEQPDSGTILFEGQDIFGMSPEERRAFRLHHIGFADQYARLLPQLTALENVQIPAASENKDYAARAKELLTEFGLAKRLDHFPAELSGGELQRVVLARALLLGPEFLLLDEPTSALDAARSDSLLGLLRDVNRTHGTAILLVTHNPRVLDFFPRSVSL